MTSMRSSFSFFLDCTVCIYGISYHSLRLKCIAQYSMNYISCASLIGQTILRNEWTNANNWRHPYILLSHNKCIHFVTKGVTQCLCMHSVSNINVDAFKMESVRNDIMHVTYWNCNQSWLLISQQAQANYTISIIVMRERKRLRECEEKRLDRARDYAQLIAIHFRYNRIICIHQYSLMLIHEVSIHAEVSIEQLWKSIIKRRKYNKTYL